MCGVCQQKRTDHTDECSYHTAHFFRLEFFFFKILKCRQCVWRQKICKLTVWFLSSLYFFFFLFWVALRPPFTLFALRGIERFLLIYDKKLCRQVKLGQTEPNRVRKLFISLLSKIFCCDVNCIYYFYIVFFHSIFYIMYAYLT